MWEGKEGIDNMLFCWTVETTQTKQWRRVHLFKHRKSSAYHSRLAKQNLHILYTVYSATNVYSNRRSDQLWSENRLRLCLQPNCWHGLFGHAQGLRTRRLCSEHGFAHIPHTHELHHGDVHGRDDGDRQRRRAFQTPTSQPFCVFAFLCKYFFRLRIVS